MRRLLASWGVRFTLVGILVASALALGAGMWKDGFIRSEATEEGGGVTTDAAVVVLDPETGRPRAATPEELQRFSEEIEESMRRARDLPARVVELPGGGVRVDVGERFMQMSVATVGKDGSLRASSVDDPEEARALRNVPGALEVK